MFFMSVDQISLTTINDSLSPCIVKTHKTMSEDKRQLVGKSFEFLSRVSRLKRQSVNI